MANSWLSDNRSQFKWTVARLPGVGPDCLRCSEAGALSHALPYTFGSREISEDDHMQAVLKGLRSIDITDLENYAPQEDDNFGFVLRAMVGPMNGEGEESFDITVCTPRWLNEKYRISDVLLGLHKLIVFKYDYLRLRQFIEKYLMRCSGDSWEEIAQKVSLLGQWEFEGYRPNSR